MAAGFRSYAFSWFTGYAVVPASPTPGCPCPDWTVEQTLVDLFINKNETSTNPFIQEQSLVDVFKNISEVSTNVYTKPATLANAWQRKACD